jgi:hypothetical protein
MTTQLKLNQIGKVFGDVTQLQAFLTVPELNIIASFPGPVAVLSVGNLINPGLDPDDLDLVSLDYVPNSTYSVLDKNQNYLFKGQTDRYFGGALLEQQLADTAAHGSFFYITFVALDLRPVSILLWLSREASLETSALELARFQAELNLDQGRVNAFSLFVGLENKQQSIATNIVILLLQGTWQSRLTVAQIFTDPRTRRLAIDNSAGKMLTNVQDSWFAVVELSATTVPTILNIWQVSRINGVGTERILTIDNDANFIAGESFNRLSLDRNLVDNYQPGALQAAIYYQPPAN